MSLGGDGETCQFWFALSVLMSEYSAKVVLTDCINYVQWKCVICHNVRCISFLRKLLEFVLLSFYAFHNLC